jgi:peptidoglycan-associated lipoprotein
MVDGLRETMMIMRMMGLAAMLLLVAACSSNPPPPATVGGGMPSGVGGPGFAPGSQQDLAATAGDRVFFAYDQSTISDEGQQILQRQAQWLQRYSRVSITIEGHCDERGTREYNLALGARRANAVKEYLVSVGVSSARLDTISYGKERPICTDSNEGCWAQNRRGVTTITGGASA